MVATESFAEASRIDLETLAIREGRPVPVAATSFSANEESPEHLRDRAKKADGLNDEAKKRRVLGRHNRTQSSDQHCVGRANIRQMDPQRTQGRPESTAYRELCSENFASTAPRHTA